MSPLLTMKRGDRNVPPPGDEEEGQESPPSLARPKFFEKKRYE